MKKVIIHNVPDNINSVVDMVPWVKDQIFGGTLKVTFEREIAEAQVIENNVPQEDSVSS